MTGLFQAAESQPIGIREFDERDGWSGELSFSKTRALTRIATRTNEEELLELARHATAAQVERIVRAWRRLDREADAERERHEARHLKDERAGDDHPDDGSLAAPRMRSLGRASRVQVVLHVDAETLREDKDAGQAVLDGGVRVSAETSRRLEAPSSSTTVGRSRAGAEEVHSRYRTSTTRSMLAQMIARDHPSRVTLIQTARTHVRVTDPPFNADRSGERDATLAFQQAVWDFSTVEVPPGRYRIRHRDTLSPTSPGRTIREHVGVVIPSGRRLFGHGSQSIILNELDDPTRPELAEDAGLPNAISWFWLDWDARDISIEGLHFLGEGPANLSPATHRENLQMCCVEWAYDAPHGRAPDHVELRRCTFERQFGFWAHGRHGGNYASILECTAVDCMNGQNVNADHSLFARNLSIRSEGFENSSSHSIFADNRIHDAFVVAMAIGGNTGQGTVRSTEGAFTNRDYGNRILGNIITGARRYGVQITANAVDTLVQGNYIERSGHFGLMVGSPDPTNVPRHTKLFGNTLVDCGAAGMDERAAIAGLSFEELEIDGNTARIGEFSGYRQEYGLLLERGRGVRVDRNRLDGHMYGMSVTATRDVDLGDANDFGPRGTEFLNNPTFRRR